jgi:WD40 repeat protein
MHTRWFTALLLVLAAAGAARAQQKAPTVAVMSPDARLVAAQTWDRIRVWERATGKLRASFKSSPMFRGAVTSGALVAVTDDGVVVRRGPRYAKVVRLRVPKVLSWGRAVLSADGRVAAVLYPRDGGVGDPDTVGTWDARTGARRARVTLKRGRVQGAALSPDGQLLAVFGDVPGGKGALLEVHRLAGKRASRRLLAWSSAAHRTTYSAAWSPDGKRLALGAGTRLLVWDVARRKIVAEAPTAAIKALFPPQLRGPAVQLPGVHQQAFSADGKRLVTLHGMQVVGIARWRVTPGGLRPEAWIKRPRHGGTMRQVGFDARGGLWLLTSTYDPRVWVHTPRGDRFATARVLAP